MAKKNSTKDTEQSLSLFGKIRAIFKNETIHFVIGFLFIGNTAVVAANINKVQAICLHSIQTRIFR